MSPYRESRMRATRSANLISRLLPLLAFPIRAMAAPAAPPTSSAAGGTIAGMVMEVALLLAMLLAIVVGIKLYDLKRRREAEVLSLQSLVSEALLLEPSLTRLPIAAFARGSLWRHSSVVVVVTGPVPTPEVRDAVMRLVERELSRRQPGARAEDRLVVDPLMGKRVA